MADKTKKVNLQRTYLFNGGRYGPGQNVVVPEDFPDLDEKGAVQFPEGSAAARNQARSRVFSSAPSTGGANTGETPKTANTVSGKSEDELNTMSKDDLAELAEQLGITVEREDGGTGDPLKSDYVNALSKSR